MKRGKKQFKPRTEVRLAPTSDRPRYFGTTLRVSFLQNLGSEDAGFAMKQERFSVEQIAAVLKQTEAVILF